MSVGQGNILVQQKKEPAPAPGPPFVLTSADNGLSVDPISGRIVLGDNGSGAATLLSNRQIKLAGFGILIGQDSHSYLDIDFGLGHNIGLVAANNTNINQSGIISDANPFGSTFVEIFSYFDPMTSNVALFLDAVSKTFDLGAGNTLASNNFSLIHLDFATLLTQIGDLNNFQNGNTIIIDDQNEQIKLTAQTPLTDAFIFTLNGNTGTNQVNAQVTDLGGLRYLSLDKIVGSYQLGDIDNPFPNLLNIISGVTPQFELNVSDPGGSGFTEIQGRSITGLGFNDINLHVFDGTNSVVQTIDASLQQLIVVANAANYFLLDFSALSFSMGDLSGVANGTQLNVDDSTSKVNIFNTGSTTIVSINGVDGFTGTVTPVTSITVNGGIVTNVT